MSAVAFGNNDLSEVKETFHEDSSKLQFIEDVKKMQENKDDFETQSGSDCGKLDFESIIKECRCTERALIIFRYFHKLENQKKERIQKCQLIFDEFEDYSLTQFVNDMDHIIKYHKKQINDGLFREKITECKLKNCRTFELNCSDTQDIEVGNMVLYQFVQENHVFLFHDNTTRDRGRSGRYIHEQRIPFTTTPTSRTIINHINGNNINDKQQEEEEKIQKSMIEEQEEKASEVKEQITVQPPLIQNDKNNMEEKSVSNTQCQVAVAANEIPPDITDETQNKIFSFGHKFEYHRWNDHAKNPFYVGCRYANLKKELIEDPEKKISLNQWNKLLEFSTKRSATIHSKMYKAHKTEYNWSTQEGKSMSTARVLAIVLYTNYDGLQSQLKASFTAINTTKHPPKEAKRAHSRFGHWSKLLRSSVDVFGVKMKNDDRFFRGLKGRFLFRLFSCTFRGPISTTTQLCIAKDFADGIKPGIVVEIKKPIGYDKSRYLNVCMWSSYKCEEEHLFNGPDNWLNITTINYRAKFSIDQSNSKPLLLFQALTTKSHHISIGALIESSQKNVIKKLNILLRNCRNEKDDYLCSLLSHYLKCTKSLKIQLKTLKELLVTVNTKDDKYETECVKLLNLFFDESEFILSGKKLYINFRKLLALFPNMEEVIIDFGGWSVWLAEDNKTWENMLEYMISTRGQRGLKFVKIAMKRFPHPRFPSQQLLKIIDNKLNGTRWSVHAPVIQSKQKGKQNKNISSKEDIMHEEDIMHSILAVAKPPQQILYFIRGGNQNGYKKQLRSHLSPMTFNNPVSSHLAYGSRKSSKKKPKTTKIDKK